jgi:hypothetical protein
MRSTALISGGRLFRRVGSRGDCLVSHYFRYSLCPALPSPFDLSDLRSSRGFICLPSLVQACSSDCCSCPHSHSAAPHSAPPHRTCLLRLFSRCVLKSLLVRAVFGPARPGPHCRYVTLVSYGFRSLHRSAADADARAPYLSSFRGLGQMWQVRACGRAYICVQLIVHKVDACRWLW